MEIYLGPRQVGKTHTLGGWLRQGPTHPSPEENTRVLIVSSTSDAERLRAQYPDVAPERITTLAHAMKTEYVNPVFAVDDLDLVLRAVLGGPVKVASGSVGGGPVVIHLLPVPKEGQQ